ncbi:hypothetical protein ACKOZB_004587 [Vibrio parahaemolyticus]|nr:hypothetical protein [Vibrio parahaemolyticus]EGQ8961576.1 hypothetical protein [Vibrio parahaemolyticus]EGR0930915.1 hypothetical protein [Vibrio parahaemolyticus]EGR3234341.1 hypothetical protein [Vibrio parahaemolyticus]EIZ1340414.1 hypothetical protein [Vibrio parahaemolyticus]
MSTENPVDYAPIVGAAIAAISTIIGVVLANWFNSKSLNQAHERTVAESKKATKLAKSEELYLALFRWHKDVTNLYLFHLRYFVGKLAFAQINELITDNFRDNGKRFDALTMLVNVHFPELKPDLELILNMRNSMAKFLSEDAPNKYSVDEFCADQDCFDAVCESFLEKLAAVAREL